MRNAIFTHVIFLSTTFCVTVSKWANGKNADLLGVGLFVHIQIKKEVKSFPTTWRSEGPFSNTRNVLFYDLAKSRNRFRIVQPHWHLTACLDNTAAKAQV